MYFYKVKKKVISDKFLAFFIFNHQMAAAVFKNRTKKKRRRTIHAGFGFYFICSYFL